MIATDKDNFFFFFFWRLFFTLLIDTVGFNDGYTAKQFSINSVRVA